MAHDKDLLLRHAALAPADGEFNVTPNKMSHKIFNVTTKPTVPPTVTARTKPTAPPATTARTKATAPPTATETTKPTAPPTATTTTKATAPLTATTRTKPVDTTLTTNITINMMTQSSRGRTADTVAAVMPSRKEKVARSVDDGNGLLHLHRKIDVNAD